MKVILFGATGMVGKSVLRECLRDPDIEAVLSIGRRPSGEIWCERICSTFPPGRGS